MTETTKSKTAKSKNTKSKTSKVEKHEFQAEVREILNLVIHSLYSNREIFLRELVSNASDACDKLRFEALQNEELLGGDSELKIEIEVDEDAGLVTVRDNGIGMSPDQLEHVFEAFTQADNSTSRKYGGTGLGLTTSKEFCEMLGGNISVKSNPGKGTVFTVRLPTQAPGD